MPNNKAAVDLDTACDWQTKHLMIQQKQYPLPWLVIRESAAQRGSEKNRGLKVVVIETIAIVVNE